MNVPFACGRMYVCVWLSKHVTCVVGPGVIQIPQVGNRRSPKFTVFIVKGNCLICSPTAKITTHVPKIA